VPCGPVVPINDVDHATLVIDPDSRRQLTRVTDRNLRYALLFCGSSVKMFLGRHCVFLAVADYAVLVLRWRVDRVESKVRTLGGIDHIMSSTGRDDDAVPVLDSVFYAVNNHLSFSSLESKELIDILVRLFTYFFSRLKAHEHWLTVLPCVQHTPEICILLRLMLKIDHVSFHFIHTHPFHLLQSIVD